MPVPERSSDTWTIRVCSHGTRVEWHGHPRTLGGWQHMDADDGGKMCASGTTRAVEVVPAAEVERLREELRIARWDADVPIRELREEVQRLREVLARIESLPASAFDRGHSSVVARVVHEALNAS